MNATRDVVLDLLPLYIAGEASAATRTFVEEYLQRDPELAQRIRAEWTENLMRAAPSGAPPDVELVALRRTRRLLTLQRWLFALALSFTFLGFSFEVSTGNGRLREAHFLFRDSPGVFGGALAFSAACWILYLAARHRPATRG